MAQSANGFQSSVNMNAVGELVTIFSRCANIRPIVLNNNRLESDKSDIAVNVG